MLLKTLQDEQAAIIGKFGKEFTKEAATEMKIMDAVIRESLRMSIGWVSSARVVCKEDMKFENGLTLPKVSLMALVCWA